MEEDRVLAGSKQSGGGPAHESQRRYPPELMQWAIRMVKQSYARAEGRHGTITRVAVQLGIGPESLRTWVQHADIDDGDAPGVTSAEAERIRALEQENRELRRANDLLKRASAFFAAELDRPSR